VEKLIENMLKNSVGKLFGGIYGKYNTKSPWKFSQKLY
jgi:hypothetical protein